MAPLPAPVAPPPTAAAVPARDPGTAFELRFGAYYHGVGDVERGTYDLSASVVTPRLDAIGVTGAWRYAIPRFQVGGNYNLDHRTSFAYVDLAWTVPIIKYLFVEPFFGGAIHNGSLYGSPTLSDLGCRELFHVGASVGAPLAEHWVVMGTFEHLSNGKGILGTDCGTNQTGFHGGGNQGLNNYGVRVGYDF